ncbi:MAG: hypothetical protein AAGH57_08295 [Pseudomonadota bacterium]
MIGGWRVTATSNITINGRAICGLGQSEAKWHFDRTYIEVPLCA